MTNIGPVTHRLKLLGISAGVIIVLFILYLVRKNRLKASYALLWIFLGLLIITVSLSTELLNKTALVLGVYYAPAALFMILMFGIIVILIHYSTIISKQEEKIKMLVQEIGLQNNKIEKLFKRLRKKK